MSLVNIFKPGNSPQFGVFSEYDPKIGSATDINFEAVLTDTYVGGVTYTEYPIENGANVVDHAIITPNRYTITLAIGDTPLRRPQDLILGLIGGEVGGAVSTVAGLASGFFGDDNTNLLDSLIELKNYRAPFTVTTGEIILENMVIENITREKTPENETGAIVVVELRELQKITNLIKALNPVPSQLNPSDSAATQAVGLNDLGEVMASPFGGVA